MIQPGSQLVVADNTGAKIIECITVLGHAKMRTAGVGRVISASVKEAIPRGTAKKKEIVKAVIVRTRKQIARKDGSSVRFDDNAAVILNEDGQPRGTRIFGPVPRELRENYMNIISLAPDVV